MHFYNDFDEELKKKKSGKKANVFKQKIFKANDHLK